MAVLHQATLVPSKLDLLRSWLPTQPWCPTKDVHSFESIGAYRFDDPEGEVGIETHLLRTPGGQTLQVPVTYRGAPLDGAQNSLIGTSQHSVLGKRWFYDACGDMTYVSALVTTIFTGGCQADLDVVTEDGLVRREITTWVRGSGSDRPLVHVPDRVTFASSRNATTIHYGDLGITVSRVIDGGSENRGDLILSGTWQGSDTPQLLARVQTS